MPIFGVRVVDVQLDRIAITLRPRSGYEAIDLGFSLATHWWRSAFLAWWLPVLPLAIALHLGFAHNPIIAVLILWWLKPLFDRFVLYSLSRRVFGHPTGAGELLGAWRQIISPGLLYALTLARLDPARSYNLPVNVLERQAGAPARQRRSLLGRRFYGTASGLTLVCLNLELIIQIGIAVTTSLFLQPGGDPLNEPEAPWAMELMSGQWWDWADSAYYLLAVGIIEPLYVAAGFSLYLNRRVLLEGWDVELALKRLAAKASPILAGLALSLSALLIPGHAAQAHEYGDCLPSGELYFGSTEQDAAEQELEAELELGSADPPAAELEADDDSLADADEDDDSGEIADEDISEELTEPSSEDWSEDELELARRRCESYANGPQDTAARQTITKVLSDDIFGHTLTADEWVLRDRDSSEADESPAPFKGLGQLIASLSQVIAWVVLAVLILMLVRHIARSWTPRTSAQDDHGVAPAELFGMQMNPDSLPDDVSASALQLIEQGKLREALALLYRACLSELVHSHGLRLNRGATEGDVLTRTRGRISERARSYVATLIGQWVELAYAEHQPQIDRLRELCAGYAEHFERAAAQPSAAEPAETGAAP